MQSCLKPHYSSICMLNCEMLSDLSVCTYEYQKCAIYRQRLTLFMNRIPGLLI